MAGTAEKRIRIGGMQGLFMIGVALTIDGVQFLINLIPIVGWMIVSILSVGVSLMFWTWFKLNGVSFIKGKTALLRVAALSVGTFVEIFPIFNSIPAWTAVVGITVITVILEDKVQNIGILNKFGINKIIGLKSRQNKNKDVRMNRRNKRVSVI